MLLLAAPALVAAQEPMFEALGQAPIVAGDRVRARDRALDEALRQAVEQATATVLEPSELVARASDLKLRIYPKAKAYIATYRILDEGEQPPGTFAVHLSASVATARLARDLSTSVGANVPSSKKARAVVCASVQGDGVDAPAAAEKALREIVGARSVEPMPGPQPCDPPSVASVLKSGSAQAALTAEVQVTPGGEIRGTTFVGAGARATVKLIEPDGRVSASGDAERGGYAPSAGDAATAAARAAVVEAARTIDTALAQRWSGGDSGPAGGVTVRVRGVERWAEYQALTRALASLPGVAGVEPRRFVRGEIDLVVHTASAASQLAGHLTRVPPAGVHIGVRAVGDAVEIDVAGEAAERG